MFSVYLGICLLATNFILTPIDSAPIPEDDIDPTPIPQDDIDSAPISQEHIEYFENENDGSGNYKFRFETSDDTKREETGTVINAGQPDQYIEVNGSFSYRNDIPEYKWRTVYYTAGKDGFNIIKVEEHRVSGQAQISPPVLASLIG